MSVSAAASTARECWNLAVVKASPGKIVLDRFGAVHGPRSTDPAMLERARAHLAGYGSIGAPDGAFNAVLDFGTITTSGKTVAEDHRYFGQVQAEPKSRTMRTASSGPVSRFLIAFMIRLRPSLLTLAMSPPCPAMARPKTRVPIATTTPVPRGCIGDCDGVGTVDVDELVTLVNIALGNAEVAAC
ncbi:MAG: hypothetical protein AB7U76_24040 [Pirellulales bacterium]